MGIWRGPAKRSRGSSLSGTLPTPRIHVRFDGTFHGSETEQLALDIEVPPPGPTLVVALPGAEVEVQGLSANVGLQLAGLSEPFAQVLEFHEAFNLPREPLPTIHVADSLAQLRVRLLREEVEEFADAVERRDLVAIADALADVVYVAYGSAVTYGLDLDAAVSEVHESNMSKLDSNGRPVLREDGKVLKSARYRPPNLGRVLGEQLPLFATEEAVVESVSSGSVG
jgi:predicted HAD superfamily Cof-like phosphohydrolase